MKKAVLFDLGGTLVDYYTRAEFPAIFAQALANVQALLRREGLLHVSPEAIAQKAKEENYEAKNHRAVQAGGRRLQPAACRLLRAMCRRFMEPILSRARLLLCEVACYVARVCPDSIATLRSSFAT